MSKKQPQEPINLLDLTPERLFGYETDEKGRIVVNMPRFHIPWMQKYLVPRNKNPFIKIKFDEFGSFVWNLCDGKTSIKDMADHLIAEFGDAIQPVYERLGTFFRQLKDRGFVRLHQADGTIVP